MIGARNSTILNEILAIFQDGPKPVHYIWRCDFLIRGQSYSPISVYHIEILRDYSSAYAEDIEISVQMLPSVYLDQVYPNRSNITATLYQIPLQENGKEDWTAPRVAEVYRAYVKGGKDVKLNTAMETGTSADLDHTGTIEVRFQLCSRALEQIRVYDAGGNYRDATPGQVLRSIFDLVKEKIRVDNAQVIDGVDMVAPDNRNKRTCISVPHGKSLIEIPRYLQDRLGGIYNADICFFLQGSHWYVWPRYGLAREEKEKRVLTIFDIPANQFPGAERTYRVTSGQVVMVSTGLSSNSDNSEVMDLNLGNGIRFTDASAVLDGMVHVEGNKAIARRGVSSSEFLDSRRDSGMDFAPMAKERISANPFAMASKLAARKGMTMSLTWENANPFLLYPGMPVRVYSLRDQTLEERRGVLTYSQYFIAPKSNTIHDGQQVCVAALGVFLSRETVANAMPDLPTA